MNQNVIKILAFALLAVSAWANGQETVTVEVNAGDVTALIDAITAANGNPGSVTTEILINPTGQDFQFESSYGTSSAALPLITGNVRILCVTTTRFTFAGPSGSKFRLAEVGATGSLTVVGQALGVKSKCVIEGFSVDGGSGGAILSNGQFNCYDTEFRNNSAPVGGGAIAVMGNGNTIISRCTFANNSTAGVGGAISFTGDSGGDVWNSKFSGNDAGQFGCDLNVNTSSSAIIQVRGNSFGQQCGSVLIENPEGLMRLENNTFAGGPGFDSTGEIQLFLNILGTPGGSNQQIQSAGGGTSKPEASCNDFGSNAFESLGYNINPTNGCPLTATGDLPNTNPQVADAGGGILVPQPGSPAIDHGPAAALVLGDDDLASLPCPAVDIRGNGRPQDGNGDGVFACDSGAVEVLGTGAVTTGHSGAFFNPARDGEGTYVEILANNVAVVYTFTYRPDGSGPAWFIGIGEVRGNSIVIYDLLRPIGARFGENFDSDDVDFTPAGEMSMVFPGCVAGAAPGNVAYSGKSELGYEGLITKAKRLSNILGCGAETPSPKAGLSGSYFDPARDGEGIIVEWLTSGDVLVVFFTYDLAGNQMWLLGIGEPNGNTVTMEALYAADVTSWGSGFDPDEVSIETWGSFTLTWDECNAVDFSYDSSVTGYADGEHHYVRLSKLADTSCPGF